MALSSCCTRNVLHWCAPNRDLAEMREEAATIVALAGAVAASNGARGLTDDEAWLLLRRGVGWLRCVAGADGRLQHYAGASAEQAPADVRTED